MSSVDRTLANLDDLGLALRDFGVPTSELEDYVSSVEPLPFPHPVPPLPVPRPTNLSFLKPGSQEIVTRPIHVYEHLPPMHPETAGRWTGGRGVCGQGMEYVDRGRYVDRSGASSALLRRICHKKENGEAMNYEA